MKHRRHAEHPRESGDATASEHSTGVLYVIATPIGNLKDLGQRACEILASVDFIACEDTRHSKVLLDHLGIRRPLLSCFAQNEAQRAPEIIARLRAGESAAIISDGGTPCISDPGMLLVDACHQAHIRVSPIPGPTAFAAALSASGFSGQDAVFIGFLPRDSGPRQARLRPYLRHPGPLVLYEAPHRLSALCDDLLALFEPERELLIARELSKLFEELLRLPLSAVRDWLDAQERIRGEFVLVLAPAPQREASVDQSKVDAVIDVLHGHGLSTRAIRDVVVQLFSLRSSEVYARVLERSERK